ncbi:MAG: DUF4123 domain-containing protein [Paracoccus sp. (in: a-proteobacteria)]|nr:DUF4123 domain-containing protein [Paracoccus sp. (in: a-proteobacteria)]
MGLITLRGGSRRHGDAFICHMISPLPFELIEWLKGGGSASSAALRAWFGEGRLYAVLDATLVACLVERLEAWDVRAASLFSGASAEQTRDFAPYLADLTESDRALRSLLREPGTLNGLRGNSGVLFFVSQSPFDDVRQHLRRFTKVPDQHGKWYFLRFWDSRCAPAFWGAFPDNGAECWRRYRDCLNAVIWFERGAVHRCDVLQRAPDRMPAVAIHERFLPVFRAQEWERFIDRVDDDLRLEFQDDAPSPKELRQICAKAWQGDFRSERAIMTYSRAYVLAQRSFHDLERLQNEASILFQDDVARANYLLEEVRFGA